MGRIRTIKPEFFLHEGLFDLEDETGLPIRLAFAGLWTQCDRAGRFKWQPRKLKATILPYDDIDFSRVLDALTTRGFVVEYESNGERFGAVPAFLSHQVINNREKESEIPEPNAGAALTREARVDDASGTRALKNLQEGKGREGKGKEGKGTRESRATTRPTVGEVAEYVSTREIKINPQAFVDYYTANGWRVGKNPLKNWQAAVRTWEQRENGQAKHVAGTDPNERGISGAERTRRARALAYERQRAVAGVTDLGRVGESQGGIPR